MDLDTPMKKCTNPECGKEYPATREHWYSSVSTKSGLRSLCKKCHRDKVREYRERNLDTVIERRRKNYAEKRETINAKKREMYRQDPEKALKRNRQWHIDNPEYKREHNRRYRAEKGDAIRAQQRQYNRENAEKQRAYQRVYRINNPDKVREGKRRYQIENAAAISNARHRRRARERGLTDAFTVEHWNIALSYFNGCCAYCGAQQSLWHKIEADHFIPIASPDCPGTVPLNMVPSCRTCNASKSDSNPVEWLTIKFGKRKAAKILKRIQAYFASLT